MAKLTNGYLLLAQSLQEAAFAMSHDDIRARLSDAIRDAYKDTGSWCYIVAVFGDDASGDVIYYCGGDLKKAAYTCSKSGASVAITSAVDVVPLTTYEVEGLTEAGARNSKRDMAQIQSIHNATSALGANCTLEEKKKPVNGGLSLVESASTIDAIKLTEARSDYEIKLIAPGKGSSAFYPAEVLKRDGPGVFKEGTHVYLNHPTAAEEAARPEGDVKNLAGVLTTSAVYHESHAKGPGLYARMKVFADHAATVEEKAPHVGMSIRASGVAESGKQKNGLPILKQLTHAESVDVVTHAGAGGMILTESARTAPANPQEVEMTEADVTKLIEVERKKWETESTAKTLRNLEARALRGDAVVEANRILAPLALKESVKQFVIDEVLIEDLPVKEGALDVEKFTERVNAKAKRVGAVLSEAVGGGRVTGLGPSSPADTDPVKLAEARKRAADEESQLRESEEDSFGRLTGIHVVKDKVA